MKYQWSVRQGVAQQGFGLIEVLVALVILSIVVLGFLGLMGRSLVQSRGSDAHIYAQGLIANDSMALMGLESSAKTAYRTQLAQIASRATSDDTIQSYHRAAAAVSINCQDDCTQTQFAQKLAINTATLASQQGIIITAKPCQSGVCWVASWGNQALARLSTCQVSDSHGVGGCLLIEGLE